MTTESIKDQLFQIRNGIRSSLDQLELVILQSLRNIDLIYDRLRLLSEEIEGQKSERIGQTDPENAQNSAHPSDSDAKNGFCTSTAQNGHAQPESVQNGQNNDEQALDFSSSPNQCCGNCAHFNDEDAVGDGFCLTNLEPVKCSDSRCFRWQHRPFHDGEAVLWKTRDGAECYKLGYYCSKLPFGHSVRTGRNGGTLHNVGIVQPLDTFNPYDV